MKRSLSIGLATILLSGLLAKPAVAQTYTQLAAAPATAAGYLSSFAYDDKHQVYLHVYEKNWNGRLSVVGRFIAVDGTLLGTGAPAPPTNEFLISTNMQSFGSRPRVAYSRESGADVFFVEYIADQVTNNNANLFGALVRYTGTGAAGGSLLAAGIPLSPNSMVAGTAWYQVTGDVAFNPLTSQFIAAWEEHGGGGVNVSVRIFNADGTAAGSAIPITSGAGGRGAPVLAFDWQRNLFCVQFLGDSPTGGAPGMFAYLLNGSTGAPASNLIVVEASPNVVEPAITYLPEADGFLTSWTELLPGTRVSMARFVPSTALNGVLTVAQYVAMSSSQSVGAPALDYDYVSRRVLMASMRALDPNPGSIGGAIFDAYGAPLTSTFNLSTQSIPLEKLGTFTPTVRAADGGVFAVSYTIDYSTGELERFQFPAAQTPGPVYTCSGNCTPPPPTDTDGDGVPDSQDACPTVYAHTANGCPTTPVAIDGDFNGDNKPEIIWQNVSNPGLVYAWFMNGLTFGSSAPLVSQNDIAAGWVPVAMADFTGDGKADILWQNQQTGQVILFIMSGTTKVGEQQIATNQVWRIVGAGDFNGDGHPDILWQNYASGQVFVWYMTSNGTSASVLNPSQYGAYLTDTGLHPISGGAWRIVGVADLNADGKPDIIWQHPTLGTVSGWYVSGMMPIGSTPDYAPPAGDPAWKVRGIGDFNADGHPDVIAQNVNTGLIAAWLLTPSSATSVPIAYVSLAWTMVGPR